MLKLEDINKEIEKLENCNPTYSICQKLATMYIIKDHLEKREPAMTSETGVVAPTALK